MRLPASLLEEVLYETRDLWRPPGWLTRLAHKTAPQECPTGVSHKTVKQCSAVCFRVHVCIRVHGLYVVQLRAYLYSKNRAFSPLHNKCFERCSWGCLLSHRAPVVSKIARATEKTCPRTASFDLALFTVVQPPWGKCIPEVAYDNLHISFADAVFPFFFNS